MLFVVMTPTGPYFRTPTALSLLAVGESVRSWPGGTGGHKLGANYASGFLPQQMAAQQGYQQCLWLIGENVTEAGAMNFFVVLKRDDGGKAQFHSTSSSFTNITLDLDLVTPPLDGTILPGLTRDSCLSLAAAHPSKTTLPGLPNVRLHTHERPFTMRDLAAWCADGKLLEAFGAGTAVIIAPVGRIGYEGKDLVLPQHKGAYGPVSRALWERIVDIQQGRVEWEGWSALCE
jgi:branched-chain amino acid aminotransferase